MNAPRERVPMDIGGVTVPLDFEPTHEQ
jgi:hypothetical protein